MLAYRHAFHAGNHADVLKHVVLGIVLRHLNRKDTPYRLIDTHAGAGGYSLEGPYARKKEEFREGIAKLWGRDDAPEAVRDYVAQVKAFNPDGQLRQYPGSPALARQWMREHDQLRLYEVHPTEQRILTAFAQDAQGVQVFFSDGYEGLRSQLPPSSKRAAVLMDPSYELPADYGKVVAAVREALRRFPSTVVMVWYPQVSRVEAVELPRRLQALAPGSWVHARLSPQAQGADGFGMMGSGMFVFNPPYTLHDTLSTVLPWLKDALAQYPGASYLLDHHSV